MIESGVIMINGAYSDSNSRSNTPERGHPKEDNKSPRPKRFLNGWSSEQERLMAEWSDIAICYRWIHDQSEKIFHSKSLWINLPVIILSTLGGTANFGVQSLFESETIKKYASFGIGGISLLAGLLTTIGNYLRYAQLEESHRVASVSWGKFQRLIAIELAMNPNDRIDSLDFLKICRAELDRLIEQSPPIPKDAINKFRQKFGDIKDLRKPDICGGLQHTHVFESSETRLKQLAVDAALMLKHKKNALHELLSPNIQENIKRHVEIKLEEVMEKNKKSNEENVEKGEKDQNEKNLDNKKGGIARHFENRLSYNRYQISPLSSRVQMSPRVPMSPRVQMSPISSRSYDDFTKQMVPNPLCKDEIKPIPQNNIVIMPCAINQKIDKDSDIKDHPDEDEVNIIIEK